MVMDFFWSNSQGIHSIHCIKKEQCQQTCEHGGLGIQELTKWNKALLMRQAWRIHSKRQLLLAQLCHGKYGTHSPIDIAYYDCKENNASWGWKGLVTTASKFKEAPRWQIRNGRTVRVLEDRWCHEQVVRLQTQVQPNSWIDQPVGALFNTSHTAWDLKTLTQLFLHKVVRTITSHQIRPTNKPDELYWPLSHNGQYIVKSGYNGS